MPIREQDHSTLTRTYHSLLHDIAELYTATRASVVRMYWAIGKRIVEVEQRGAGRSAYGRQLIPRLSADLTKRLGLGFSERNLHRMKALYLQRKILPPAAELSWSHQAELLSLPLKLRQQLATRAQGHELTRDELRALVQEARERLEPHPPTDGQPATPPTLLTPKRGTPGLFQIKDLNDTRYVDWGFESYRALTEAEGRRFSTGAIVRCTNEGTLTRAAEAKPADLYTYDAHTLRVVDGDTVWMLIHLTDAEWRKEKLRLRGIDCPELGTAAGDAAKRYVQTQVQHAARVVITTTKPDKWDRYLSDIYLTIDGTEMFLNNRLLELGHAHRYDAVKPKDWES